jgi:nitrate/nitrite transport system substrate-binding protein
MTTEQSIHQRTKASARMGRRLFIWRNTVSDTQDKPLVHDQSKRDFMKKTTGLSVAAALMAMVPPGVRQGAWAAGSDAPEKPNLNIGFIPLTDCASVVMASVKGFDKKYGLTITPTKEASWAAVRDKLVNGELDAAHVLYGLIYGVQMGIGGPKKDMAVLATLNNNGQAITLSNQLHAKGVTDGASLAKLVAAEPKEYTFAQTFPTGTHAMWLYYWLATYGINPFTQVKVITVPPPQMVANMRVDNMDGYCVGEPWNARAVAKAKGFTTIATQDLWLNHPEKALVVNETFATEKRDVLSDVMKATLEACQWCDDPANVSEVARIIGVEKYVNATPAEIESRLGGTYDLGADLGTKDFGDARMRFHRDGQVNLPRSGHAIWFMAQYVRFGYLDALPPAKELADKLILTDLYAEVASSMGITVPDDAMAPFEVKLDGNTFDPTKPELEAARS